MKDPINPDLLKILIQFNIITHSSILVHMAKIPNFPALNRCFDQLSWNILFYPEYVFIFYKRK